MDAINEILDELHQVAVEVNEFAEDVIDQMEDQYAVRQNNIVEGMNEQEARDLYDNTKNALQTELDPMIEVLEQIVSTMDVMLHDAGTGIVTYPDNEFFPQAHINTINVQEQVQEMLTQRVRDMYAA